MFMGIILALTKGKNRPVSLSLTVPEIILFCENNKEENNEQSNKLYKISLINIPEPECKKSIYKPIKYNVSPILSPIIKLNIFILMESLSEYESIGRRPWPSCTIELVSKIEKGINP